MNDVMNGNDLMTQSMDPSALIQRLDNTSSISGCSGSLGSLG